MVFNRTLSFLALLVIGAKRGEVSCYSIGVGGRHDSSNIHSAAARTSLRNRPTSAPHFDKHKRNAVAQQRRRKILVNSAAAVVATALFVTPSSSNAVISSKPCVSGVGEGCDALSEDNEFIRQLQAKSAQNKQANEQEALNAYYMKNYPDYFAALNPPRYMVKQPDGSFKIYTDKELAELQAKNLIKIEVPKTMGGKLSDLTQKPIMVLVPQQQQGESTELPSLQNEARTE